jgi:hypothetical protein
MSTCRATCQNTTRTTPGNATAINCGNPGVVAILMADETGYHPGLSVSSAALAAGNAQIVTSEKVCGYVVDGFDGDGRALDGIGYGDYGLRTGAVHFLSAILHGSPPGWSCPNGFDRVRRFFVSARDFQFPIHETAAVVGDPALAMRPMVSGEPVTFVELDGNGNVVQPPVSIPWSLPDLDRWTFDFGPSESVAPRVSFRVNAWMTEANDSLGSAADAAGAALAHCAGWRDPFAGPVQDTLPYGMIWYHPHALEPDVATDRWFLDSGIIVSRAPATESTPGTFVGFRAGPNFNTRSHADQNGFQIAATFPDGSAEPLLIEGGITSYDYDPNGLLECPADLPIAGDEAYCRLYDYSEGVCGHNTLVVQTAAWMDPQVDDWLRSGECSCGNR